MEAKDTVMKIEEMEEVSSISRYDKDSYRKVAEAQAEISFDAGKEEGWKDAEAWYHIDTG